MQKQITRNEKTLNIMSNSMNKHKTHRHQSNKRSVRPPQRQLKSILEIRDLGKWRGIARS